MGRRLGLVVLCLLLLLLGVGVWAWLQVRGSLPLTAGELDLAGLTAPVTIERDSLGIPVIRAENFADAMRAHGFVHAQDRFFQMDLGRRATAGELAGLVGERALVSDLRQRPRLRRLAAGRLLAELDAESRRWIEIYSEGVNAGLETLAKAPPEYLLLRAAPEPWLPEDSLLAVLGFFDMLSTNHWHERAVGVMAGNLPPELVEFLTPSTSRWDRPVIDDPNYGYQPASPPGPEVVDLRGRPTPPDGGASIRPMGHGVGSNNWAVSAAQTAAGHAILASDPHLGLRVPHVWHRVQFEVGERRVVGVGAPGLPGVIIGSNGDIAWGATNSFADQTDFVVIEVDPDDPARYLTPDGAEPFVLREESIVVAGGEAVPLEVRSTRWGPIIEDDWLGRPLAERSPIHDAAGLNFSLLSANWASTLEEGVAAAAGWRGASQNWLLAAADGRIAWVVNGPIPVRRGFTGKAPVSWASGENSWLVERPGPQVIDPAAGRLATANGRTVPHDEQPLTHFWIHSGRVQRIHELLDEGEVWDEESLRAIQLDTASAYHRFARDIALGAVTADEADPLLQHFRAVVESWNGTAEANQAGFVAVGRLADAILSGVLGPLLAPAIAADSDFVYNWALADEPVRRLLEERPVHLVPPPHATWDDFLRATVEQVARDLAAQPGGLDRTWGEARTLTMSHPLGGLPVLGAYLNMPTVAVPGWAGSVRSQTARYGASMRLVVSPGREEFGLLHMPTGQSGHFMSPHYADQQQAWVEGLPTPLLAGEPVAMLRLRPAD